ncbi:MAG: zinc-ribbon domain containing protein [Clostridia bacterium]|nr:zinc-ribbon domain containing protein [Clostridia bacterium]
MEKIIFIRRTCKTCGEKFIITAEEIAYKDELGQDLPTHCKECRKKRRNGEKQLEADIYEAFANNVPTKRRRHHVQYPPHVVGGFR